MVQTCPDTHSCHSCWVASIYIYIYIYIHVLYNVNILYIYIYTIYTICIICTYMLHKHNAHTHTHSVDDLHVFVSPGTVLQHLLIAHEADVLALLLHYQAPFVLLRALNRPGCSEVLQILLGWEAQEIWRQQGCRFGSLGEKEVLGGKVVVNLTKRLHVDSGHFLNLFDYAHKYTSIWMKPQLMNRDHLNTTTLDSATIASSLLWRARCRCNASQDSASHCHEVWMLMSKKRSAE